MLRLFIEMPLAEARRGVLFDGESDAAPPTRESVETGVFECGAGRSEEEVARVDHRIPESDGAAGLVAR